MASRDRDLKDLQKQLSIAAKVLQTVAKPIVNGLTIVVPFVITQTRKGYHLFMKLPQNALHFTYGSVFCFFGGTYPTLFAAMQAAEYGGRMTLVQAFSDLSEEAITIINESKKDDDADDNKDGTNDVSQISSSEYLARKTKLVLRKMNPEKVDNAISSIYRVWISVAAVLSIEFAKTISMAMAIADFLKKPLDRFVTPTLKMAVPDEYDRWVPVVMSWVAKSIAMSLAWYVQSVVSAFSSALKGGLMMGQATYRFCIYRNMTLFGWIKPNEQQSNVDEALSYVFAGLGFYTQFKVGFKPIPPLNYILWPFGVAENYIRWSITNKVKQ